MKKKLILFSIPLLVIAIIAGIFLIRYRSAGEVLLSAVSASDDGAYLLQAREVGARQIRLSRGYADQITLSPNGRYVAFTNRKERGKECLVYDLTRPRKPVLRLTQYTTALQPLDDGRLLSIAGDHLYLNGEVLAENIRHLGAVSGDGSAIYCFRQVVEDRQDLCRISLSDGSLTTILENAHHPSLQLTQGKDGQEIIICAQKQIHDLTMYDLVHDSLAETDAASTDEEAMQRNELRKKLKEETLSNVVYTVYRIVGEKQEVLAEGVTYDFFCDPLTGMVVHRLGRLYQEPVDILTLRDKYVPVDYTWWCTVDGTSTPLLHETTPAITFTLQFSGEGAFVIQRGAFLRLWQLKDGIPVEAEVVKSGTADGRLSAHFLRNADGSMCLYYTTRDGQLFCHDGEENRLIRENIWGAYLPCRVLPDGTKQQIDDRIYIIARAESSSSEELLYWWPDASTLYLVQNGEETVIANISNSYMSPLAALSDGSLLAESGPLYIVGPNRTDRLFTRISANEWSNAVFAGTELVKLS